MPAMRSLEDILEEYEFLDGDERYRLLIELGRELDAMPDALKTDATKVRGCMSQVWMVPGHPVGDASRFAFAADSDAHIVKGLIAVLGVLFSGKTPADIAAIDIDGSFKQLGLDQHLSPTRRNGLVSMVSKIKGYATTAA